MDLEKRFHWIKGSRKNEFPVMARRFAADYVSPCRGIRQLADRAHHRHILLDDTSRRLGECKEPVSGFATGLESEVGKKFAL